MKVKDTILYANFFHCPESLAGKVHETPRGYYFDIADIGVHSIIEKRVKKGFTHNVFSCGQLANYAIGGDLPILVDSITYGKSCNVNGTEYVYIGKRGSFGKKPNPVKGPVKVDPVQKPIFEPIDPVVPDPVVPDPVVPDPVIEPIATNSVSASILACRKNRVPVMLWGPSGTGKSYIAMETLKPYDPLLVPLNKETRLYTLMGYMYGKEYVSTPFRQAIDEGRDIIIDECDTNPRILLALNSAISNGTLLFPDKQVEVTSFFVMTSNTNGQGAGNGYLREALDLSTSKRFAMIHVDYNVDVEYSILPKHAKDLWTIRKNIINHGIQHCLCTTRDFVNVKKLTENGVSFLDSVKLLIVQGHDSATEQKILHGISI